MLEFFIYGCFFLFVVLLGIRPVPVNVLEFWDLMHLTPLIAFIIFCVIISAQEIAKLYKKLSKNKAL